MKQAIAPVKQDSPIETFTNKEKRRSGARFTISSPWHLATSVIALAIVLYHICPTVYYWDSAELAVASYVLGIPHPPGFPLYVVIGRLFTLLPFADIGFRLNLFSVVACAATVFVLSLTVSSLLVGIKDRRPSNFGRIITSGFLLAMVLCFSSMTQAVRAEVYYPNLLIIATALYFLVRSDEETALRNRTAVLAFFLLGLGTGIHHLTLLLTIPGMLLLARSKCGEMGFKRLMMLSFSFIAGASIYLFIPIRFSAGAEYCWGDPSTLTGFWSILTSGDTSIPADIFSIDHLIDLIAFYVSTIYKQVGIIGITGALIGFFHIWKRNAALFRGLLSILVLNTFSILFFEDYFYGYKDLHGYLLPSIALTVIVSILGWIIFIEAAYVRIKDHPEFNPKLLNIFSLSAVSVLILLSINLSPYSLKGNYSAKDLSDQLSAPLDDNSVVLCGSINSKFLLDYAVYSKADRADPKIIDIGSMQREWYLEKVFNELSIPPGSKTNAGTVVDAIIARYKNNLYFEFSPALIPLAALLIPDGLLYRFGHSGGAKNAGTDLNKFPMAEGDIESERIYAEWLMSRGLYFYSNREKSKADSCFSVLTNMDPDAADIIGKYESQIDRTLKK
jgi:hypothetical protein